jgi:hypothetical protein
MIYINSSQSVLAEPLPKRMPVSDWVHPKIPHRRRGKRHHHGDDVCGLVVIGSTKLSVLFLLYESYGPDGGVTF